MREIASFHDERAAKLFADVLCARDIDTEISRSRDGAFTVWVLEERHVEVSRAAWASFDANPDAPEHAAAAGCVDRKVRKEEVEQRRSRHEIINVRSSWRSSSSRPAAVTLVLVGLSIAVTLAMALTRRQDLVTWLSIGTSDELVAEKPFSHVLHGEVWRLVTPIFVHLSFVHILFNMWWLLDLGSVIESRIGTARFATLVLLTAALSNAAQYVLTGSPYFGGMSGVLYALFGYIWVRSRMDPSMGLAVPRGTIVVLLLWLALGFTGWVGPVANFAHLGGLISGALLGALAALRART